MISGGEQEPGWLFIAFSIEDVAMYGLSFLEIAGQAEAI